MVWLIQVLRDVVLPIIVFVVLPLVTFYVRDRRKTRAQAAVAERTVEADVTLKDTGALGASVAFVQEAFRVERESKDREIQRLTSKVAALEENEARKDVLIAELREQVADLTTRLARLEGTA